MCRHCPAEIFDVDPDVPLIALACPKCREVAFYTSATAATRSSLHHATQCGTDTIRIIEVMEPADDTWTARAHN